MALCSAIRRTTITTADMARSLAFYCEGLGFDVWYDDVVDDPVVTRLLGVKPGVKVRVAIVQADESETGKIGLMEFIGQEVASGAGEIGAPPKIGETVTLFYTDQMNHIRRRLLDLGFDSVGEPEEIRIPSRPVTYEMAMRDPNGARLTLVQFGELDSGPER